MNFGRCIVFEHENNNASQPRNMIKRESISMTAAQQIQPWHAQSPTVLFHPLPALSLSLSSVPAPAAVVVIIVCVVRRIK